MAECKQTWRMGAQTERLENTDRTHIMGEFEDSIPTFHGGVKLPEGYRLIKRLTVHAGEAIVYLCEDANNSPRVIKCYRQGLRPHEPVLRKLMNMNSPFIVKVLDTGELDGCVYEVQPYYPQGNLLDAMPVSLSFVRTVLLPAVNQGLKELHAREIVHRDIKPTNLFLADNRDYTVIGDFGISSQLLHEQTVRYTSTSRTIGYAAPESAHGFVSVESDYYSLGITILHLATGVDPFANMSELEILMTTLTGQLPIPRDLDEDLANLIEGLTRKDRLQRWGSDEVQDWIDGVAIPRQPRLTKLNLRLPFPYTFGGEEIDTLDVLALKMARNWEDGQKQLYRGILASFLKPIRPDIASVAIDFEAIENKDVGLFELIYSLDPNAPLCWKGRVFMDLKTFGQSIPLKAHDESQNLEYYVQFLTLERLSAYMKYHEFPPKDILDAKNLEAKAKDSPLYALWRLKYWLTGEHTLVWKTQSFSTPSELIFWLANESERLDEIAQQMVDAPQFHAWLEQIGFADVVARWRSIPYEGAVKL